MSLFAKLRRRADEGRPVRVGLIGAGKFGSMYLSQAPRTPGIPGVLRAVNGRRVTTPA